MVEEKSPAGTLRRAGVWSLRMNARNALSVAVIDCGVGNHRSVLNALSHLGVTADITSDPAAIQAASHLIFPGVGSFAQGMAGVRERNLRGLLTEEVMTKKKPILGLCLGMQLFTATGEEHGTHEGLGWIPGTVTLIKTQLRLPHIGWNNVRLIGDHSLTKNFGAEPIFYFVHSYHMHPDDPSIIAGITDYGTDVTAIIQKDNIQGTQFHPEKSHDDGMRIFRNFLNL